MNARKDATHVTSSPCARTLLDHTTVNVSKDSQEMEKLAKVRDCIKDYCKIKIDVLFCK